MRSSNTRILMIAILVLALANGAAWGDYAHFERGSSSSGADMDRTESGWSLEAYQADVKAAFEKVKVTVETYVRSVFTVVKAIGKAIITVVMSIAKLVVRAVFIIVFVFARWLLSALFGA